MTKPEYKWDAENKIASCSLIDEQGRKFYAEAKCHPDDYDFANEYTGYSIALERVIIKYLTSVKRDVLEPGLAALNQLFYSMNTSKNFNPHSYEAKMLRRQIRMKESDLKVVKQELADRKRNLKLLIQGKDLFYKKTRAARKNQQDESK